MGPDTVDDGLIHRRNRPLLFAYNVLGHSEEVVFGDETSEAVSGESLEEGEEMRR